MFILGLISISLAANVLDSPLEQVLTCGTNYQSFILTSKGSIYKDYTLESPKFNMANFSVTTMLHSEANKSVIYFIGDSNVSFYTVNCGRNYTQIKHDRGLYDFKLNPMNASQIIAFKDRRCNSSDDPLCKDKYKKDLYISENYGDYWYLGTIRVRDASWDKLLESPLIPDNRIVAAHLADNGSTLVSYSDDFYRSKVPVRWNTHGFYQTKEYLFALIDADSLSKGYDLEVTPAEQWKFTEVVLPVEDRQKYTFTVLDTVEHSIFISVSHLEEFPKLTNIYKSDTSGITYALSLLNNVRSLDTGTCDFEPIIDGVYIANIYDSQEFEKFKQRRSTKNLEAQQKLEKYKQSRITFDRGGEWYPIKAPKYDFKGQPTNCAGECSLHLLGKTEAFRNAIVSQNHIVIGTGNTGLYLSEQSNTYLSRDSGHTWFEVLEGIYVYEVGGNTGVIVFVQDDEQASELLYTWDEGLTFQKVKLNITFDISSIVFSDNKFMIYGVQDAMTLIREDDITQNSLRGVFVTLYLRDIMPRKCEGFSDPGGDDSDYEYWSPTNYSGDKCIFGKKVKYIRRKRKSNCYNPEPEQQIFIENCACTIEDWECDVNHMRNSENKCVPIKVTPKPCRGTYMKSQGYRKIPADQCQGGIDLSPIETKCNEEDSITIQDVHTQANQVKDAPIEDIQITGPKKTITPKKQEEKGGVKWGYLIIGVVLLVGTVYIKKKLDKKGNPQKGKQQQKRYYPQKQNERQSLFSEL